MRPVQLKTLVLGYPSQNASSPFKFDLSLNYRLQNLIIQHSEGQPTLVLNNFDDFLLDFNFFYFAIRRYSVARGKALK